MNIWVLILIGWLAISFVMAILWLVQLRTGDAGIVDVAWSLGVGGLAFYFALNSPGLSQRVWMILGVVLLWSVRLAGHVLYRVLTQPEDGRYQSLKQQWGQKAAVRMFRFYQLQALGVVVFSLPILVALRNPQPLSFWDLLGLCIGVLSIAGESLSDWQLSAFKSDPENRGRVCQQGLWRYSRHPNYFFEWLHWWSYFCFALTRGLVGGLTITGPIAMWYFITRVTGIPPTEAQSLRTKGESYRQYQLTTSAFFPWFPKSNRG